MCFGQGSRPRCFTVCWTVACRCVCRYRCSCKGRSEQRQGRFKRLVCGLVQVRASVTAGIARPER